MVVPADRLRAEEQAAQEMGEGSDVMEVSKYVLGRLPFNSSE